MSAVEGAALAAVLALAVYLLWALLFPEDLA